MENSHQVRLRFALLWVFCLVGLPRWNVGLPPALDTFLELWRLVAAYQVLFRKRRGGFGATKHISHHKGRAPLKLEVGFNKVEAHFWFPVPWCTQDSSSFSLPLPGTKQRSQHRGWAPSCCPVRRACPQKPQPGTRRAWKPFRTWYEWVQGGSKKTDDLLPRLGKERVHLLLCAKQKIFSRCFELSQLRRTRGFMRTWCQVTPEQQRQSGQAGRLLWAGTNPCGQACLVANDTAISDHAGPLSLGSSLYT